MIISKELLVRTAGIFGVEITDGATDKFDRYAAMLLEWNQKFNLTAITNPDAIVVRHFADSLTFFAAAEPAEGASLIDVGSGAGFPALPIAIVRGDMQVTALDSTGKRVNFLSAVADELALTVSAVHMRAEDAAARPDMREQYDFATARAVANMRELSEYCLGFVKVGGSFVALKGPSLPEELDGAKKAIETMGGLLDKTSDFTLPDGSRRCIAVVNKRSQTPTAYPRKSAKIAKFPLV